MKAHKEVKQQEGTKFRVRLCLQHLTSGDSKAQWYSPTVTYSAESHSGECSVRLYIT